MGQFGFETLMLILLVDVVILAGVVYFLTRYFAEKFKKDQQNKADALLLQANEKSTRDRIGSQGSSLESLAGSRG